MLALHSPQEELYQNTLSRPILGVNYACCYPLGNHLQIPPLPLTESHNLKITSLSLMSSGACLGCVFDSAYFSGKLKLQIAHVFILGRKWRYLGLKKLNPPSYWYAQHHGMSSNGNILDPGNNACENVWLHVRHRAMRMQRERTSIPKGWAFRML